MEKTICVVGLGYIGLPMASMFATHGWRVVGVDINREVLAVLNRGEIHIEETGLREMVREATSTGKLVVRDTPQPADVFYIAVPTPITADKKADMRAVTSASESIVPFLRQGNLVMLESTSPPGTTVGLVQPILERSGLKAGKDFRLAYSPERVLPGQILKELVENARIVGGVDRESAEAGRELYSSFVQGEIVLTDATTAEMVKLMENTSRDVNIALANEFAIIAENLGIDVWEAIELANRHPRIKVLRPGPGVGGHCVAVDPWFLVDAFPQYARLIRMARQINDGMPERVVEQVESLLEGVPDAQIACLGLTFKQDVDDVRESPAVEIVEKLVTKGLKVRAFDPHVKALPRLVKHVSASLEECLDGADLILLLVHHTFFVQLQPEKIRGMRGRLVFDTRGCLPVEKWEAAGFSVHVLGHNV